METSPKSKINYILIGVLIVLIVAVGALFGIRREKARSNSEKLLSDAINQEYVRKKDCLVFFDFAQKKHEAKEALARVKNKDLYDMKNEEYDCVQISMWNDDVCSCEWFTHYFGQSLFNANGLISNPEEMRQYLGACMDSDNRISRVFLCLDPDELEKNYYENVYYDREPISYEDYLSQYIIPYIGAFGEVDFCVYLPCYSISYLASLSDVELKTKFDNWYKFIMYLHWCNNVRVSYLGAEEWLVTKNSNYVTNVNFVEEVEQLKYLYEYAYEEYIIKGPECLEKCDIVMNYVDAYRRGEYDWKGLENRTFVFLGDSIFDYEEQDELCIPRYFANYTKVDCYRIAKCGSLASSYGDKNFCDIAKDIKDRAEFDESANMPKDYQKLLDECNPDDEITFVINYGINDYFSGIKIDDEENPNDSATYKGALHKGINTLKLAYPNSNFVILSPYLTYEGDYGTRHFSEYGGELSEYVEAAREQAEIEDALFVNMFDSFNITKENMDERLVDGVHPAITENIFFSKLIYEAISQ